MSTTPKSNYMFITQYITIWGFNWLSFERFSFFVICRKTVIRRYVMKIGLIYFFSLIFCITNTNQMKFSNFSYLPNNDERLNQMRRTLRQDNSYQLLFFISISVRQKRRLELIYINIETNLYQIIWLFRTGKNLLFFLRKIEMD